MPPALIFDLDGTLVDSLADIHAAVGAMLADFGHAALPPETVRGFVGNGVPTLIARILGATGLPHPAAEVEACFMRHYEAAPAALTRPYPGVAAALTRLSAAGHPMAICTNKPEAPARAILRDLGLAKPFACVIGGDTLPVRKPDPAPALEARTQLGGRPALFVGDSEVDAATADAAGLPFLLFTGGYRKGPIEALAQFDTWDQLPDLIATVQ